MTQVSYLQKIKKANQIKTSYSSLTAAMKQLNNQSTRCNTINTLFVVLTLSLQSEKKHPSLIIFMFQFLTLFFIKKGGKKALYVMH